jgi:hypothetical protein
VHLRPPARRGLLLRQLGDVARDEIVGHHLVERHAQDAVGELDGALAQRALAQGAVERPHVGRAQVGEAPSPEQGTQVAAAVVVVARPGARPNVVPGGREPVVEVLVQRELDGRDGQAAPRLRAGLLQLGGDLLAARAVEEAPRAVRQPKLGAPPAGVRAGPVLIDRALAPSGVAVGSARGGPPRVLACWRASERQGRPVYPIDSTFDSTRGRVGSRTGGSRTPVLEMNSNSGCPLGDSNPQPSD